MGRLARSAVVAAAAACIAASPTAAAEGGTRQVGCDDASSADFHPDNASPRRSGVFGPLTLVGAGDYMRLSLPQLRAIPWFKMPALLEPGRTVTLTVARSHRRIAGWVYGHRPGSRGPGPEGTVERVTLTACPPGKRGSTLGTRPVTFWSGGLEIARLPICLPLTVHVDGERRARRWTFALGRDCPR